MYSPPRNSKLFNFLGKSSSFDLKINCPHTFKYKYRAIWSNHFKSFWCRLDTKLQSCGTVFFFIGKKGTWPKRGGSNPPLNPPLLRYIRVSRSPCFLTFSVHTLCLKHSGLGKAHKPNPADIPSDVMLHAVHTPYTFVSYYFVLFSGHVWSSGYGVGFIILRSRTSMVYSWARYFIMISSLYPWVKMGSCEVQSKCCLGLCRVWLHPMSSDPTAGLEIIEGSKAFAPVPSHICLDALLNFQAVKAKNNIVGISTKCPALLVPLNISKIALPFFRRISRPATVTA